MTTPERLRRRQIRNDWFIAILAFFLASVTVVFFQRIEAQRQCLSDYIATSSETSKARAELVERDALATRTVILKAGSATSREDFLAAINAADREWIAVDKARAANPVKQFDPEKAC